MGIPIVRGRSFQPTDATSSGLVAIVNEKFADTFWKGRDPIGQRVKPSCTISRRGLPSWAWRRMSSRAASIRKQEPSCTWQFEQIARPAPGLGMRHSTTWCCARTLAPAALSQTIERVVRDMDRAVPVARLRDMEEVFAESIQRPRFLAQLLGLFAGLALLLAAVGTYGVVVLHRCGAARARSLSGWRLAPNDSACSPTS